MVPAACAGTVAVFENSFDVDGDRIDILRRTGLHVERVNTLDLDEVTDDAHRDENGFGAELAEPERGRAFAEGADDGELESGEFENLPDGGLGTSV